MRKKCTKTEKLYNSIHKGDKLYVIAPPWFAPRSLTRGGVYKILCGTVVQKQYVVGRCIGLGMKFGRQRKNFFAPDALNNVSKNYDHLKRKLVRFHKECLSHHKKQCEKITNALRDLEIGGE